MPTAAVLCMLSGIVNARRNTGGHQTGCFSFVPKLLQQNGEWHDILREMRNVKIGSRGAEVKLLQRLLNLRMTSRGLPAAELREDGVFDPRTHLALVQWQEATMQASDEGSTYRDWAIGLADRPVLNRMGLQTVIEWYFRPFAQQAGTSCWTAAYLLMLREEYERWMGEDRAQRGMIWRLGETENNIRVFARMQRLRILNEDAGPQGASVSQWLDWLRQGPLLAIGAGRSGSNRWEHACLVYGAYSDENPDGSGTVFCIHDPAAAAGAYDYGATYSGINVATPHRKFSWEGVYLLGR